VHNHPDDVAHRVAVFQRYIQLRTAAGISQQRLSRMLGRAQGLINEWERTASLGYSVATMQQRARAIGHPLTITMPGIPIHNTPEVAIAAARLAIAAPDRQDAATVEYHWAILAAASHLAPATEDEIAARRGHVAVTVDDAGRVLATVRELAARCGAPPTLYRGTLANQLPPHVYVWQSVARALGGRCVLGFTGDTIIP